MLKPDAQRVAPRNCVPVFCHVDLDCFYCQVEQRRLGVSSDQPLAVQQWESLIAVNYPARACSIRRGEKVKRALALCPDLKLVHVETLDSTQGHAPTKELSVVLQQPNWLTHKVTLQRYRDASAEVLSLLLDHCQQAEKASIDEVYFDLTAQVASMVLSLLEEGPLEAEGGPEAQGPPVGPPDAQATPQAEGPPEAAEGPLKTEDSPNLKGPLDEKGPLQETSNPPSESGGPSLPPEVRDEEASSRGEAPPPDKEGPPVGGRGDLGADGGASSASRGPPEGPPAGEASCSNEATNPSLERDDARVWPLNPQTLNPKPLFPALKDMSLLPTLEMQQKMLPVLRGRLMQRFGLTDPERYACTAAAARRGPPSWGAPTSAQQSLHHGVLTEQGTPRRQPEGTHSAAAGAGVSLASSSPLRPAAQQQQQQQQQHQQQQQQETPHAAALSPPASAASAPRSPLLSAAASPGPPLEATGGQSPLPTSLGRRGPPVQGGISRWKEPVRPRGPNPFGETYSAVLSLDEWDIANLWLVCGAVLLALVRKDVLHKLKFTMSGAVAHNKVGRQAADRFRKQRAPWGGPLGGPLGVLQHSPRSRPSKRAYCFCLSPAFGQRPASSFLSLPVFVSSSFCSLFVSSFAVYGQLAAGWCVQFMAKVASAHFKPNQQVIVPAAFVSQFLSGLELKKLAGLGGKRGSFVSSRFPSCKLVGHLQRLSLQQLQQALGAEEGSFLYSLVRGAPVGSDVVRSNIRVKSMLAFKSLPAPGAPPGGPLLMQWLRLLSSELHDRASRDFRLYRRMPKTLTLHYSSIPPANQKFSRTCQVASPSPSGGGSSGGPTRGPPSAEAILQLATQLLTRLVAEQQKQGAPLKPCLRVALALGDFADRGDREDGDISGFFAPRQKRGAPEKLGGPPDGEAKSEAEPAVVVTSQEQSTSAQPQQAELEEASAGAVVSNSVEGQDNADSPGAPPLRHKNEGAPHKEDRDGDPHWKEDRCISLSSEFSGNSDSEEEAEILEIIDVSREKGRGVDTPEMQRDGEKATKQKGEVDRERSPPRPKVHQPSAAAAAAAAAAKKRGRRRSSSRKYLLNAQAFLTSLFSDGKCSCRDTSDRKRQSSKQCPCEPWEGSPSQSRGSLDSFCFNPERRKQQRSDEPRPCSGGSSLNSKTDSCEASSNDSSSSGSSSGMSLWTSDIAGDADEPQAPSTAPCSSDEDRSEDGRLSLSEALSQQLPELQRAAAQQTNGSSRVSSIEEACSPGLEAETQQLPGEASAALGQSPSKPCSLSVKGDSLLLPLQERASSNADTSSSSSSGNCSSSDSLPSAAGCELGEAEGDDEGAGLDSEAQDTDEEAPYSCGPPSSSPAGGPSPPARMPSFSDDGFSVFDCSSEGSPRAALQGGPQSFPCDEEAAHFGSQDALGKAGDRNVIILEGAPKPTLTPDGLSHAAAAAAAPLDFHQQQRQQEEEETQQQQQQEQETVIFPSWGSLVRECVAAQRGDRQSLKSSMETQRVWLAAARGAAEPEPRSFAGYGGGEVIDPPLPVNKETLQEPGPSRQHPINRPRAAYQAKQGESTGAPPLLPPIEAWKGPRRILPSSKQQQQRQQEGQEVEQEGETNSVNSSSSQQQKQHQRHQPEFPRGPQALPTRSPRRPRETEASECLLPFIAPSQQPRAPLERQEGSHPGAPPSPASSPDSSAPAPLKDPALQEEAPPSSPPSPVAESVCRAENEEAHCCVYPVYEHEGQDATPNGGDSGGRLSVPPSTPNRGRTMTLLRRAPMPQDPLRRPRLSPLALAAGGPILRDLNSPQQAKREGEGAPSCSASVPCQEGPTKSPAKGGPPEQLPTAAVQLEKEAEVEQAEAAEVKKEEENHSSLKKEEQQGGPQQAFQDAPAASDSPASGAPSSPVEAPAKASQEAPAAPKVSAETSPEASSSSPSPLIEMDETREAEEIGGAPRESAKEVASGEKERSTKEGPPGVEATPVEQGPQGEKEVFDRQEPPKMQQKKEDSSSLVVVEAPLEAAKAGEADECPQSGAPVPLVEKVSLAETQSAEITKGPPTGAPQPTPLPYFPLVEETERELVWSRRPESPASSSNSLAAASSQQQHQPQQLKKEKETLSAAREAQETVRIAEVKPLNLGALQEASDSPRSYYPLTSEDTATSYWAASQQTGAPAAPLVASSVWHTQGPPVETRTRTVLAAPLEAPLGASLQPALSSPTSTARASLGSPPVSVGFSYSAGGAPGTSSPSIASPRSPFSAGGPPSDGFRQSLGAGAPSYSTASFVQQPGETLPIRQSFGGGESVCWGSNHTAETHALQASVQGAPTPFLSSTCPHTSALHSQQPLESLQGAPAGSSGPPTSLDLSTASVSCVKTYRAEVCRPVEQEPIPIKNYAAGGCFYTQTETAQSCYAASTSFNSAGGPSTSLLSPCTYTILGTPRNAPGEQGLRRMSFTEARGPETHLLLSPPSPVGGTPLRLPSISQESLRGVSRGPFTARASRQQRTAAAAGAKGGASRRRVSLEAWVAAPVEARGPSAGQVGRRSSMCSGPVSSVLPVGPFFCYGAPEGPFKKNTHKNRTAAAPAATAAAAASATAAALTPTAKPQKKLFLGGASRIFNGKKNQGRTFCNEQSSQTPSAAATAATAAAAATARAQTPRHPTVLRPIRVAPLHTEIWSPTQPQLIPLQQQQQQQQVLLLQPQQTQQLQQHCPFQQQQLPQQQQAAYMCPYSSAPPAFVFPGSGPLMQVSVSPPPPLNPYYLDGELGSYDADGFKEEEPLSPCVVGEALSLTGRALKVAGTRLAAGLGGLIKDVGQAVAEETLDLLRNSIDVMEDETATHAYYPQQQQPLPHHASTTSRLCELPFSKEVSPRGSLLPQQGLGSTACASEGDQSPIEMETIPVPGSPETEEGGPSLMQSETEEAPSPSLPAQTHKEANNTYSSREGPLGSFTEDGERYTPILPAGTWLQEGGPSEEAHRDDLAEASLLIGNTEQQDQQPHAPKPLPALPIPYIPTQGLEMPSSSGVSPLGDSAEGAEVWEMRRQAGERLAARWRSCRPHAGAAGGPASH
ncbi:hypothetical protein Emed_001863 [Eimeria media]